MSCNIMINITIMYIKMTVVSSNIMSKVQSNLILYRFRSSKDCSAEYKGCDGPMAKKHAGDKKFADKKKKDKKKTLKRL